MAWLDTEAPPARPRRRGRMLGLVVSVVLGGLFGWHASRRAKPQAVAPRTRAVATARPAAANGVLDVTADAKGARVILDGRAVGRAPWRIRDLAPGRHRVRVEAAGRAPYEVDVHVIPGQTTTITARLPPERMPAPDAVAAGDELIVESDIPGASVFVDRRMRGTTPLRLRDVGAGSHRVHVTAEGQEMQALDVQVSGSTRVRVSFKDVQLDEAVAVQHKHAFGSCEGRLVATPAGLRYEPPGGDHGFFAALDALRAFEVDYLKKELRVKVAGKGYTFTTRAPNADPLLVFQRKVDAARRRLSAPR